MRQLSALSDLEDFLLQSKPGLGISVRDGRQMHVHGPDSGIINAV